MAVFHRTSDKGYRRVVLWILVFVGIVAVTS
jgi:hypothetical protein